MTQIPRVTIVASIVFALGAFAIFLLFPAQHAEAASMTFSTDTTISTGQTIASGEIWTINSGVQLTIESGITITNNFGTIVNHGVMDNQGTIDNGGTMNNTGSITNTGILNNIKTINNDGTIDNGGTINNDSTITNNGTVNNTGTVNNFDFIDNHGTINNNCGAIFNNSGEVNDNPVNNETCVYNLNLFEGANPSDLVVNLNQEARAAADTNDASVTEVTFRWIDPSDNIVQTEIVSMTLGSAESTFTPDEVGTWIVEADFGNGEVVQQTLNVGFLVIPESPIGMVALVASSFLALGGFMLWKTRSKSF